MSLLKGEGKKELKLSILPCAEICIFLFHPPKHSAMDCSPCFTKEEAETPRTGVTCPKS